MADLHRVMRQPEAPAICQVGAQYRVGQPPVERVGPAVILAKQVVGMAALLFADAVAGVQAGIAQGVDAVFRLAHQHDRAAADIGAEKIAVGGEPAGVIDRQPRPREDMRDFGGEDRVGLEQLRRRRNLAARFELLADRLDAVGKLHCPVQYVLPVLLPL